MDCRYDYEFNNGHIKGAINCPEGGILFLTFTRSDSVYKKWNFLQRPVTWCKFPFHFFSFLLILLANLDEEYHRYRSLNDKICFVFHCEFSSHRGPKAYTKFRDLDRRVNELYYPKVTFKEIYLLDGGYKAFFNIYPVCNPRNRFPKFIIFNIFLLIYLDFM